MHTEMEFVVGEERLRATLDHTALGERPSILMLHGAGQSNRSRFSYLADRFRDRGFGSFRFDFSGHGESSGTLATSSLAKRMNEARAAATFLALDTQPILVGSSMGAHIASRLAVEVRARVLILFSPAAFGAKAENLVFGPDFTKEIRTPGSYENSLVFGDLRKFAGDCLIVAGQNDNVIPEQVLTLYFESLVSCRYRVMVTLKDAPHRLHEWLQERPDAKDFVLRNIDVALQSRSKPHG
jgi:pimeloyl-ACP methyl ester carboxylesterase